MLAKILAREVNLLLLDEPTNHLDMDSIEALTEAINRFEGSIIVVTHSEELLRRVCDRLVIFTKDGAEYFDGGYDEFLEKIGWEEEFEEEKVKSAPKSNTKELKRQSSELIRERNANTSKLKKEVEKLEAAIIKTEEHLTALHKELIEASNSGESAKLMDLSKLVAEKESSVDAMFEELEIAQTQLDAINAEYNKKIEALS
jgi:ATP-binding cassette subfamily F protein 3